MNNQHLITKDHVTYHKIIVLLRSVEELKSPILLPSAISHRNLVSEEFKSHSYVVDSYM